MTLKSGILRRCPRMTAKARLPQPEKILTNHFKNNKIHTMKIKTFALICAFTLSFFIFIPAKSFSKTVYSKKLGDIEFETELDAYYTALDFYIPLTDKPIPCLEEEKESAIYKKMFTSPKPRFAVIEFSVYPMPCSGIFIKKNYKNIYDKAEISDDLNLVKSLCAGFEEPYAVSAFIGDVVSFRPEGSKDIQGKGYTGFLFSFGNYHIKDNESISDNWFEFELKAKGDRISETQKLTWSLRGGSKIHYNADIEDVIYFSIRRDRTDFLRSGFSLLENSNFEYILDLGWRNFNAVRHLFTVGKKFPLKNKKQAFSITMGVLWESGIKYLGDLKGIGDEKKSQIVFRPNFEF
ncbi:MAG: hypothetical protein BWY26_00298 [Elusimicrobia bacterium ADurb.Bin231]|nr:MAG: hypothetical protein BWY26_00298 [Elusimicrobia bacterium ADurb.Bin231]